MAGKPKQMSQIKQLIRLYQGGSGIKALLLQAEADERDEKRFERLKQNAGFRYQASIQELNMVATRGLDKGMITSLATGEYIKKGDPILISGATGCGNVNYMIM